MLIERQAHEFIFRVPDTIELDLLQELIDYLNAKSILAKSEATDKDVECIATEINSSWWKTNKARFIK